MHVRFCHLGDLLFSKTVSHVIGKVGHDREQFKITSSELLCSQNT